MARFVLHRDFPPLAVPVFPRQSGSLSRVLFNIKQQPYTLTSRKLIVKGLNNLGLNTFEPHGAFYAFPQISVTGMNEDSFAERLLQEEKVAVVPGSAFGLGGEGFVRCSYATSYEKIEEALRRIERFMRRMG